MEEIIVGVVGVPQFDVLKYRLENEYKVDIRLETLPYEIYQDGLRTKKKLIWQNSSEPRT